MDISIIIVNYKSKDKVVKCLDSIRKADLADLSYEIIVVDNASGDDFSSLKKDFSEIKIIQSEKNSGMGGGNNLGVVGSSGDFFLILNPDTEIKDDAIPVLLNYLRQNRDVGIVGPKLLNTDGTLQYSCMRFPKVYTPFLRRTFFGAFAQKSLRDFLMEDYDHEVAREVDWLMGSCLLVRRDIFDKDGFLFDEKYFMYFEDTDLCRRVWQKHKMKVVYLPSAVVVHDHARASAENPWYVAPFKDKLAREHLRSWFKYFFR